MLHAKVRGWPAGGWIGVCGFISIPLSFTACIVHCLSFTAWTPLVSVAPDWKKRGAEEPAW